MIVMVVDIDYYGEDWNSIHGRGNTKKKYSCFIQNLPSLSQK